MALRDVRLRVVNYCFIIVVELLCVAIVFYFVLYVEFIHILLSHVIEINRLLIISSKRDVVM